MAAKKTIIFSFVYYPRFIGGAEVAVKEITDRISESDMEFHLVALRLDSNLPREERVGNVFVHRVGFAGKEKVSADSLPFYLHLNKYFYPFLALWKGASLHKKKRFDLSWAIMANYSGFGGLFFKLFHLNIPFIFTLQEGDPIDYILKRTLLVRPLFKMIFTYADRIQAISNYLADFGKMMDPSKPADRVVVVPNGVDVDRFSAMVPFSEIEKLKNSLGKKPGDIFLVTASRLVVKNAVGDIISSLSYLPENVKLLILGRGYEEAKLRDQAKGMGLQDRVIFKGFISHAELPLYLQASDIFVRPSLSEGFGNSFIEAMAAGIPVIATRVGGIVDFLKDKETGLFCEVGDPQDIARKAEIYMRDKNLRDEIIDNAMHMVVDHYDWKMVSRDMKNKVFDPVIIKP